MDPDRPNFRRLDYPITSAQVPALTALFAPFIGDRASSGLLFSFVCNIINRTIARRVPARRSQDSVEVMQQKAINDALSETSSGPLHTAINAFVRDSLTDFTKVFLERFGPVVYADLVYNPARENPDSTLLLEEVWVLACLSESDDPRGVYSAMPDRATRHFLAIMSQARDEGTNGHQVVGARLQVLLAEHNDMIARRAGTNQRVRAPMQAWANAAAATSVAEGATTHRRDPSDVAYGFAVAGECDVCSFCQEGFGMYSCMMIKGCRHLLHPGCIDSLINADYPNDVPLVHCPHCCEPICGTKGSLL